jgi:hypothetical protein
MMAPRSTALLVSSLLAACGFRGPPEGVSGDAPDADAVVTEVPIPTIDAAPQPDAFTAEVVARYNLGGGAFTGTDYPGAWAADPGTICVGTVSNLDAAAAISGTVDDALFQKQLYAIPTLTCHIPVANGHYSVTMLFGPIYYSGIGHTPTCNFARDQIFDITIETIKVVAAYNLTADSGGCVENGTTAKPVSRTFVVSVTDGAIDISLQAPATEAAMLSALQILTAP